MIASFSSSTVPTTNKTKCDNQFKTRATQTHLLKVSCNTTPNEYDKTLKSSHDTNNINRRNLLLGVGLGTVNLTLLRWTYAVSPSTAHENVKKVEDVNFPVKLNQIVRVLVKRPAVNRSKEDKKKANEILILNGIKFDGEKYVKFDVFVNDKDNEIKTTPADSEFAGSFAQLPHGGTEKMMMTSGVRFGLTELLEDLKAEDDEYVLVSLVPRTGSDDVTVSEIKIELVPIV